MWTKLWNNTQGEVWNRLARLKHVSAPLPKREWGRAAKRDPSAWTTGSADSGFGWRGGGVFACGIRVCPRMIMGDENNPGGGRSVGQMYPHYIVHTVQLRVSSWPREGVRGVQPLVAKKRVLRWTSPPLPIPVQSCRSVRGRVQVYPAPRRWHAHGRNKSPDLLLE